MSPLELRILLYHRYAPLGELWDEPSPAAARAHKRHVDHGLLKKGVSVSTVQDFYVLTPKGDTYLDAILSLPEPVEVTQWLISYPENKY